MPDAAGQWQGQAHPLGRHQRRLDRRQLRHGGRGTAHGAHDRPPSLCGNGAGARSAWTTTAIEYAASMSPARQPGLHVMDGPVGVLDGGDAALGDARALNYPGLGDAQAAAHLGQPPSALLSAELFMPATMAALSPGSGRNSL